VTQDAAAFDPAFLVAVLDRLVPADGGFPSAGEVALAHVSATLSANPRGLALLAAIEARSAERHGGAFTALPEPQQIAVLAAVEAEQSSAFSAFLVQVYNGYYSHPRVVQALGLPPGPPSRRPHQLQPLQPSRLDQVAARGPIYRPV
jgi:hypothetical protein